MASLPKYLQYSKARGKTYYRYLLPDGQYSALGTDREEAIQQANALNKIREERRRNRGAVSFARGRKMLSLLDTFEPVKLRSTRSKATTKEWARKFKRYREWMGDWNVDRVSVLNLDTLLEEKAPDYDPYRQHRLLLIEVFAYALGKGWRRETNGNPAKALLPPRLARIEKSKTRQRLNVEEFNKIRVHAKPWLQLAMDLALGIGIRRGDICHLKLESFQQGYLKFIPQKTSDLPHPAALKIKLGPSLKDIESRSRNLGPLSPYFLHANNSFVRCDPAKEREHWTQVLPEQLSRHFASARKAAMIEDAELFKDYDKNELPGFHEIRSLCARQYEKLEWPKGHIQTLLGHADEEMTQLYLRTGEVQWQEIELG